MSEIGHQIFQYIKNLQKVNGSCFLNRKKQTTSLVSKQWRQLWHDKKMYEANFNKWNREAQLLVECCFSLSNTRCDQDREHAWIQDEKRMNNRTRSIKMTNMMKLKTKLSSIRNIPQTDNDSNRSDVYQKRLATILVLSPSFLTALFTKPPVARIVTEEHSGQWAPIHGLWTFFSFTGMVPIEARKLWGRQLGE